MSRAALLRCALACVAFVAVACGAFLGPMNEPVACPRRCATGGCCGYDEQCTSIGCRFIGDPLYGEIRDAGADR